MENKCVTCGAVIPEGRQVCPNCESKNSYKLKPCPFCGGQATIYKNTVIKNLASYSVFCSECYARTYGGFDKGKDAIDAWNRRITENERV